MQVFLIIYWAICLLVGAGVIAYQILSESHATTAGRKSFHCLAVIVYLPGMLYEPTLLYLASGVIMGLFIVLEVLIKNKFTIIIITIIEFNSL